MRTLVDASLPREIEIMMQRHFPVHCAALGAEGSIQTVRDAISRGRALHFEDAQLPAYVALEFAFDTSFSTNPKFPWAQAVLRNLTLPSALRMEELRSEALRYLATLAEAEAAAHLAEAHNG